MPNTKNESCCTKEFCCCAPDAEAVFLAGSFNDWSEDSTPMVKDDQGVWRTEVDLAPGRHEYKFIIDGQWRCEPNWIPNEFGTMNQFIDV